MRRGVTRRMLTRGASKRTGGLDGDEMEAREEVGGELLKLDRVSREFGGVHAAREVSFVVREGTALGIIGPNGAGKSTVLSMIAGSLAPSSGRILFGTSEINGLSADAIARRGIIRTFQVSAEFAGLTVMQNLLVATPQQRGETVLGALLGRRCWGESESGAIDRARALLKEFGMAHVVDEYAGNLSGGQRRLLEVMRAMMAKPRVLLLDEPTAGVHPNMVGELRRQLQALRDSGLTLVMVEHEMGIVGALCDSVVVMARGAVIAQGSLASVRGDARVMEAYLAG